jgi:CDP-6-deoxy-D-xylo-4-hexulose-3-dehydrase
VTDWRDAIVAEWERRHGSPAVSDAFPLMEQTFTSAEIVAATETLLSGQLTMHDRVRELEERFAASVGAPYAVMVNSGSSANLLAVGASANPVRERHLGRECEVLVPAVCWSTSVWPFVQAGLSPVFVDVDPKTMNLDVADLKRKITPRTRAIMVVHVLGNSCDMLTIGEIAREHDLIVIEDTCESLGSLSHGRAAGTHAEFGTYSFYYSHHMTTGEGGMVVCQTLEDLDLLRCLRAHGWTRQLSNRAAIEAEHPDIDPRFVFLNVGYNVRPLEVQAAIGLVQLERLPAMNEARNTNRERILAALEAHPRWRGQFQAAQPDTGASPTWFGLAMLLNEERPLREFLAGLTKLGVENRPAISGNFTRQPAWKRLGYDVDPAALPGAETVHHRGFFIGLQSTPLSDERVETLADRLLRA